MKITIDGSPVMARRGETILAAATRAGIDIPTLCHDGKLAPYASCWICAVKVHGEKRLTPACATEVSDGMAVTTEDEEIRAARRLCLELLLSDHCGECLPPCRLACPAGCDAPGYLQLILDKRYGDALRLIRETVPLPATIGRICPHPCEEACHRNVVDQPASLCALKRFVADRADGPHLLPERKIPSGKRVAVIGSGPAGLSAAYYLSLEGHAVTVLEAREKPGGMLRYGIPHYRLPKSVLDREIDLIRSLGVRIECGTAIGGAAQLPTLRENGYDAILVAVGAQRNRSMGIPGEDIGGVLGGIDFLAGVASGMRPRLGDSVIVVGGGDTAIDAARTALRLGAKRVSILYRRSREEMPAGVEEIQAAEEEGIAIAFLILPLKISRREGRLSVTCTRMELGEPDENGRRKPIPLPGSEHTICCDSVIMAIGQSVDASVLDGSGLQPSARGRVEAAEDTFLTPQEGVFAAGDCVTGPDIAIRAIAAGRGAAFAMDSFLKTGKPAALRPLFSPARRENKDIPAEEYRDSERLPRTVPRRLPPPERTRGFSEVEKTMDEDEALRESYRCLGCGCASLEDCTLRALAERYGIGASRFGSPAKRWKNDERHPYILRDPDKCIKCARCIRVCREVQGIGAWGYIGRGFGMQVAPPFTWPLQDTECESCGQCLTACPTGALVEKSDFPPSLAAFATRTDTTCGSCGIGCPIAVRTFGNRVIKITPRDGGNLCKKGVFDPSHPVDGKRLLVPMVRRGGRRVPASLNDIRRMIAEGLRGIHPREIAVFVSPRLTDAEAYEAQRLARVTLRTNNIYPAGGRIFSALAHRRLGRIGSPGGLGDIATSDAVVLVNPLLVQLNEVAALSVIRAVRDGARLLIVGRKKTKLDRLARDKLMVDAEKVSSYAKRIAAFAHDARRPVLVCNRDSVSEQALIALHALAAKEKAVIVSLTTEINGQGLLDAGVSPFILPGQGLVGDRTARKEIEKKWGCGISARAGMDYTQLLRSAQRGKIKAVFFLGAHPPVDKELLIALRKARLIVAQATAPSPLTRLAHVLLPAAGWAETSGTFTRYDGEKLRLRKALPPLSGYSNIDMWRAVLRSA